MYITLCPCFHSVSCSFFVLPFITSTALLFVLPIPRFFFFFFFISLSRSLIPCLPPSLCPSHSRRRATSVELIRYSRHIWTALTGINHEYFEVPMQRFFRLLVVSSAEPAHGVLLLYLQFHAKSLSLPLPCKVSTSASTGSLTLSTCAFHRKPTQYVLIRTHPPNLACLSGAHSQPERWLLLKQTATLPLHGEVVSIPVVWSFHPVPCFLHITHWPACRHDNNMSLWQQTSQQLDPWVFGHVMLLKAFNGSLVSKTADDNSYFLLCQTGLKPVVLSYRHNPPSAPDRCQRIVV